MKKFFLILAISLICTIANAYPTIDSFLGRWYEKVTPSQGPDIHQLYTTSHIIDIEVSYGISNIYSGVMNDISDAANQWSTANHYIVLNPIAGGNNFNFSLIPNQKNTIAFDNDGLKINPFSSKRVGYTQHVLDYTKINVFGTGDDRRFMFKECDIALHKNDPQTFKWVSLSTSNINQTSCYEYDVKTVISHEMGHFLGLGHAKGSAANHSIMAEAMYACDKKSNISTDDINAAFDLYKPGPNLIGVLPKEDFKKDPSGLPCRTYNEIWQSAADAMTQSCRDDCKNDIVCTVEPHPGGFGGQVGCSSKKTSLTNNLGISDVSVANLNTFVNSNYTFNFRRSIRLTTAYLENGRDMHKVVEGFVDYTSNQNLNSQYQNYKDLYVAIDKLVIEFAPLIDATFRCEANITTVDLTLKQKHVDLIENVLDEILALQPYVNLTGELNYLKSIKQNLLGKNIKEAYVNVMNANDTSL
jgi:predicted Zn-dependent protease